MRARLPAAIALPAILAAVVSAAGISCHPRPAARPVAAPLDDTSPAGPLDDRARPTGYALELTIDPAAAGFRGKVEISLDLRRPTKVVWLHARGLTIDRAEVAAAAGAQAAQVVPDPRTDHVGGQGELLGLAVATPVAAGAATLTIAYHGTYGTTVGLIKTTTEPAYVYSDLEPIDARAMTPCFDEPRWKAPWRVALVVPSKLLAIANGPERRRAAVDADHVRVEFAPTGPMPSYLVAVAVGDLEATPAPGGPVPLRIITPRGFGAMTAVAAAALPGLIAHLAQYLDEPLPLAKLDVLAIPFQDDATKGMENPGLITLVDRLLLADPAATGGGAVTTREGIVHALAHEVAHQWLGDLVTIDGWGDLWLQEGGASWLGIKAAREVLGPTWVPPYQVNQLDSRLKDGARPPIAMAIHTPTDIAAMFRIETYAGGAAVFDALEAWLGPDTIQAALQALIHDHRDGALTVAALVDDLAAKADPRHWTPGLERPTAVAENRAEIGAAIAAMTTATRMPTVRVEVTCKRETYALTLDVDDPAPLPVCVTVEKDRARCELVRGHATWSYRDACQPWYLPNPGGGAPYRRGWSSGSLAAVLASPLSARDDLALYGELLERLLGPPSRHPEPDLATIDRLAAATFLAATATAPMVADLAVAELDAMWRAAPDAAARARLTDRVAATAASRPLPFVDGDRDATTALLAAWLARHGVARYREAAAKAVPDLVAAVKAGHLWSELHAARAAAMTAREADALTALIRGPKPPWAAAAAIGAAQLPDVVSRLRKLLADPALTTSAAMAVLGSVARNPAAWPHLAELALLRKDLGEDDRVNLATVTCDPAAARPLLVNVSDAHQATAAMALDLCADTRAAWPADL